MRPSFVFLVLFLLSLQSSAQGRRYRYIGLQPGAEVAVVDPYFSIDVYRVNVFPVAFQTPINRVFDFKVQTLGIFEIGDEMELNAAGLQLVFPRFFEAKGRFSEKSFGWYLGPIMGAIRQFDRNFYGARTGLEWGRYSESVGAFSWTFNLQAGISRDIYVNKGPDWTPFVGLNLGLGFWLKQEVNVRGGAI